MVVMITMPLFLGDTYSSPQRKKPEVCNLFLKIHQKKPKNKNKNQYGKCVAIHMAKCYHL